MKFLLVTNRNAKLVIFIKPARNEKDSNLLEKNSNLLGTVKEKTNPGCPEQNM